MRIHTYTHVPQLQDIAFWLETSKMAFNLTGNLLGGPVAADLLKSMQSAINTTSDPTLLQVYPTLLVMSSHYNTQLGLLAALDIESSPGAEDIPWRTQIPSLASVLAFELHKLGGTGLPASYYVRAVYQDGPGEAYKTLPLTCSTQKDGSVAAQVLGMMYCVTVCYYGCASQGRARVRGRGFARCCSRRRFPRSRSGARPAITTARRRASWRPCGVRRECVEWLCLLMLMTDVQNTTQRHTYETQTQHTLHRCLDTILGRLRSASM